MTVAVQGAIPIGEFGWVLIEVGLSKLVIPSCGDIGAAGEVEVLTVGLENVGLLGLEDDEGLGTGVVEVVDGIGTPICADIEGDMIAGGSEDEVVG